MPLDQATLRCGIVVMLLPHQISIPSENPQWASGRPKVLIEPRQSQVGVRHVLAVAARLCLGLVGQTG